MKTSVYLFILVMYFLLGTIITNAADTGTLLIQGTVAAVNNITITPNGTNNTTLDIVNGETSKLIATVTEQSNNLAGYKINIKSLNGSELRNTGDTTKKTTYTINYNGGSAITLTTIYQQAKNVASLTGLTSNTSNLHINVNAYTNAPAGTYEDTITLQIVGN